MRLDKFLQVSRLVKRRTIANTLCSRGDIYVNGQPAKAGKTLTVGDVLRIPLRSRGVGATDSPQNQDSQDSQDGQDVRETLSTVSYEVVDIPTGNVSRARAPTLTRKLHA